MGSIAFVLWLYAVASEETDQYVLSLSAGEDDRMYLLSLGTLHYENYSTFVFFDDPISGVYFTTGSSALDLVIESLMKLTLNREGGSELYSRAVGALDYLEADMEFPDAGVKLERTEVEMDS